MTEKNHSRDSSEPLIPIPCDRGPVDGPFDTIVIGSGISGLAGAATLARTGDRVLVLERHFQVGGFTHVFRRGPYEWDVGVHYLGTIHPRSGWYLQLSALTDGRMEFEPIGEVTDVIRFPGLEVRMPTTYDAYKQVLAEHFPSERDGISAYLDKIDDTRKRLTNYFASSVPPKPLTKLARSLLVRTAHEAATVTTDQMMSRYIKDERLKDVLDAQWGNIGMPRRRCSFLVHAAMLGFYLESGGVYPVGGSSSFARQLGRTIYDHGSKIRVKAEVERILISGNKAIGVRLKGGEEILAKRVISSVGAYNTYNVLLAGQPRAAAERAAVGRLPLAYEYMNLFLGLDRPSTELGLGPASHWIYRSWDTGADIFWDVENPRGQGSPKIIFASSSSSRDPHFGQDGNTGHNAQVVFIGAQGAFDRWRGTKWKKRGADYEEMKKGVSEALTAALDVHFPGLRKHVKVAEISTPLSYETFTGHPKGIPYGVAPIPERYESMSLRPQTPFRNLYLCGQDLVMPGVSAAFGSAMMCTSLIRRRNIGAMLKKEGARILGV